LKQGNICVPGILKGQRQWVVWGVPGELPKAPFNPESLLKLKPDPAKSGVPGTWGAFENAERCVSMGLARGIGYEFAGQGIYGVDLDGVLVNGGIAPQAREIVEGLNSYTEISPSGRGLHIFVTADNANITRHRKQGGFVEIYTDARYFTVTGNVHGGYDRLADRPAELQRIHDRYLLPEPIIIKNEELRINNDGTTDILHSSLSTFHYLRRGLVKDHMLRACWNGERRRQGLPGGKPWDESASDQALMNKLAYWCNADPAAMTSAFLQSPYYSQKDAAHQKKCQRADYLPNTVKTACATLRSTAYEDTLRYQRARNRDYAR